MSDFKDAKGDRWEIAINGATIKRCLESGLKVDLGRPLDGDPPVLTRFSTELAFRVDLLYVVLKPQAEERGLSDLQVAERLDGDVLYAASTAFLESWAFFFRSLRQEWLAEAIGKEQEAERAIFDVAAAHFSGSELGALVDLQVQRIKGELEAETARQARELASRPGSSSASSPPSPVAGPSPERSGSSCGWPKRPTAAPG